MLDYESLKKLTTQEKLAVMLTIAARLIPDYRRECHGSKCREGNCVSCYSEEHVEEYVKQLSEFKNQAINVLKEAASGSSHNS